MMTDDRRDNALVLQGAGGLLQDPKRYLSDAKMITRAIERGDIGTHNVTAEIRRELAPLVWRCLKECAETDRMREVGALGKLIAVLDKLNLDVVTEGDKAQRLDRGDPTDIKVVVEYSDKHVTFKHD